MNNLDRDIFKDDDHDPRNEHWDGQDWTGVVEIDDENEEQPVPEKQPVEPAQSSEEHVEQPSPEQSEESESGSSESLAWDSSGNEETADQKSSQSSSRQDKVKKNSKITRRNSINAEKLKEKRDLLQPEGEAADQPALRFQKHLKKFNVFTDLYQSSQDKMITQNIRKSMDERKKDRQQILRMQIDKEMTWWQKVLDFRFTPNKGFKIRWDLFIIFLSIYNSFMIPIQFAMPNTMDRVILVAVIDQIVDVLFAIDIIIMFRTSYQDQKTDNIIRDSKLIAINYIKGRFFIDLLASVPFDLIGRLITTTPDARIDPSTTTFLSILKMTRLLRLGRMVSYFQINQAFKFGMKMLQMFLFILIFLNLVACIWIKIFNITPEDFEELGASREELKTIYNLVGSELEADQKLYKEELQKLIDKYGYPILLPEKLKFSLEDYYSSNPFWQYNLMIFMTLFNIMGNDISPTELQIFWVSAALMLTGFLVVSNLIGEFSNILNDIYEADKNNEIEENSEIVGQVLQSMQVPEEIQNRVYDYLEFGTVKTDYVRSKKFFQLISDCQQDIIKMISFEQAMRGSGLFSSHNDLSQIKFFIQNMEVHVYLPQDVIVKQNDMADNDTEFVYFIIEGFAQVIQERRDFCYFHQGNISHFLTEHEQEEDADEAVAKNLEEIAQKGIAKFKKKNTDEQKNDLTKPAKEESVNKPNEGVAHDLDREIDKQADKQRVRNQNENFLQDKLKMKFQEAKSRNKQSFLNRVLMRKEKKQVDTQKEMILQRFKSMFNSRKQKNYVCINEVSPHKQSYFGEIAAISNLRRTSTLVATNPMLIGKVKISFFKQYYENNTNFRKRVQKHVFTYNDWNMKMIFNMLRNAQLFGSQYAGQHFQQVCLDTLMNLKEESFHHMDSILELGEVSDRLYFVTQGRVAVFVNMTQDYNKDLVELNENILDEENNKKKEKDQNRRSQQNLAKDDEKNLKSANPQQTNKLLQILNVGSNFNQISAILSQQTIFTYCAIGSNCQVASISKQDYEELCEKHHFIKKLKRFIEEIYNDSGKKYDFQRYTHQNHWANGINVQGLDQNEDQDLLNLNMNQGAEESDENEEDKEDQFQGIIKDINNDKSIGESDSDYFSMSDVSIDSAKSGQEAEGGSAEPNAPAGGQQPTAAMNLFKNALAKQLKPEEKVESNETQVENTRNSLARFITNKFSNNNSTHNQDNQSSDQNQQNAVAKERDRILKKLNWNNLFSNNNSQASLEKDKKKEELKEQMIMFQLKSNKNWLKISCQLKFRQFIRLITRKVRNDKSFMQKNFKIFAQVDMLQKARLIRMMNLRMIMARQIVINNSIKLELIEKMNNVTCLAKYRNKNLALNKAIIERAKKMQEKEKNKENQKSSMQQPVRDTLRHQGGTGPFPPLQKPFQFDIDNQQKRKSTKKKSQNVKQHQDLEISPDFVSNKDDSSDGGSMRRITRLDSPDRLPQIEIVRARSPTNTIEGLTQQNPNHLPPIVPILQDTTIEPTPANYMDPNSQNNKLFQNQESVNQLIRQQQLLVQNRQNQIEQLMNCLRQNEEHFKELVRQSKEKKQMKEERKNNKQE